MQLPSAAIFSPFQNLTSRKCWAVAYLAMLLLPWGLIFSRVLVESCTTIIGLLWLHESFIRKQWKWLHDPVVKIGLVCWAWLLISTLFSYHPNVSLTLAAPWIRYILLYAALCNWLLVTRESLLFLCKMLAGMLCFVIIDSFWQYITGVSLTGNELTSSRRLTGPLDNMKVGIFVAKLIFPTVGIALFFSTLHKNCRWTIISVLFFIIGIVIIMLAGERTAFGSMMIAVFGIAILFALSEPRMKKFVFGSMAVIFLAIGIILMTQKWVMGRALEFYSVISNYSATNYGQLAKAGYIMGQEHPWMGAGLKNFRVLCPTLVDRGEVFYCNLHPHNPYMEWFSETGTPGLILFIALIGSMLMICLREFCRQREEKRLLPTLVLATLIANFFPLMPTQSFFSNWPAMLLWYSVSVALASLNALKEEAKPLS